MRFASTEREEVQQFYCRARVGSLQVSFRGSSITVPR